jgi:hypothetical protein
MSFAQADIMVMFDDKEDTIKATVQGYPKDKTDILPKDTVNEGTDPKKGNGVITVVLRDVLKNAAGDDSSMVFRMVEPDKGGDGKKGDPSDNIAFVLIKNSKNLSIRFNSDPLSDVPPKSKNYGDPLPENGDFQDIPLPTGLQDNLSDTLKVKAASDTNNAGPEPSPEPAGIILFMLGGAAVLGATLWKARASGA